MISALLSDRYRILRSLGQGGFSETFLAEDIQMPSKRQCVVKLLKPIATQAQVYQLVCDRFKREAVILENLGKSHTQVPELYAYFESQGQFYLVQEYIEGETLSCIVQRRGNFNENNVRDILINILPVLEYVHSKHIIHRDIKPDNIILRSSDKKPVLIDFGAVRETMGTISISSGIPATSIIIGTPGFMPFEQGIGKPVISSDLYALGLTAIYLLTGKSPQQLEIDPLTEEIVWRQLALNVSSSFKEIIDRAVKSRPRDRFSTDREMLDALQFSRIPISSTATPPMSTPITSATVVAPPLQSQTRKNSKILSHLIIGSLACLGIISGFILIRPFILSTFITSISRQPISPTDFITNHYALLNQRQYQTTWYRLTSNFQKRSGGYIEYVNWWETVQEIKIEKIDLIDIDEKNAIVDVKLRYIMKKTKPWSDNKPRIYLVWNNSSGEWSIDRKEAP